MLHAALVQDDDAIGNLEGILRVMGEEHGRDVQFVVADAGARRRSLRTLASTAPKGSSSSSTLGSTASARGKLAAEKIEAVLESARQTIGVPCVAAERE